MSMDGALRTAIVNVLETVPSIGAVHPRLRYATDTASFLALFTVTIGGQAQVRGWAVSLERTQLERQSFGPAQLTGQYIYQITGWLGMADTDASEETLSDLAEAVILALSGADLDVAGAYPQVLVPNITQLDHVMLGTRLCNRVTISCPVLVSDSGGWS